MWANREEEGEEKAMSPLITLSAITGIASNSLMLAQQQEGFTKPPYGGTPNDPWKPLPGSPAALPDSWDKVFPPGKPIIPGLPTIPTPEQATDAATSFLRQQGLNIALAGLIVLSIYALLRGGGD